MISVNATFLVQLSLFLFLLFIVNRIMIQPIHRVILERERYVRQRRQELVALQEEIRRIARDCEARLQEAERRAREGQLAVKEKAGEEAHDLVTAAKQQSAAIHEKVRLEVDRELAKARQEIAAQAELLSSNVATKVLGRQI